MSAFGQSARLSDLWGHRQRRPVRLARAGQGDTAPLVPPTIKRLPVGRLIWNKCSWRHLRYPRPMVRPFLYRCPTIGSLVQGTVEGEPQATEERPQYEPVECAGCGGSIS